MTALSDRIKHDGIEAKAAPALPPRKDSFDATWYSVTLRFGTRVMVVPYGMGTALRREPTADDVLQSLLLDASGADLSLSEWLDDCGYDDRPEETAEGRRVYKSVKAQTRKLRRFLNTAYDSYLECAS